MIDRIVKFLASPQFALTCLLTGVGLVALAAFPLQFIAIPGDQIARMVTRGVPFVALYAALALATLACFRKRWKAIPRLVKATVRLPNHDTHVVSRIAFDDDRATRALRRVGFRSIAVTQDRVTGVRSRFGPLGNHLFHSSILFVVGATLIGMVPGGASVSRVRIAEGESVEDKAEAPYGDTGFAESIPVSSFSVENVEGTSVGRRPATLRVTVRDAGGQKRLMTAGVPWVPNPVTVIAAEDFGLSATFSIVPSGSVAPIASRTVDLTDHGFKTTEYFKLRASTGMYYRIGVKAQARPLSTSTPAQLRVSVAKSKKPSGMWRMIAAPQTMTVGGSEKAGDVSVRLVRTAPHASFRIQRSIAGPLALLGLLLAAIGSLLRLAMPRTEATIERAGTEGTAVRLASDVYRTAARLQARLVRAWEEDR